MPSPTVNYSVALNARPALAGGAFAAGQAVTQVSQNSGFVLANTANVALAGGAVYGIALEPAVSGGAAVQVCTSGYVPPEVVGSLSGTGNYVDFTSVGGLVRATAASASTLGRYMPDGGVVVDLNLQIGGAVTGNATAIQGTTVSSASAARSYVLRGDGTNIRSVFGGRYHLEDWGAVDPTGSTSISSVLAAIAHPTTGIPSDSTLVFPAGTFKIDEPWILADDTARGNKYGITIEGAGANELTRSGTILASYVAEPNSTSLTYVSRGTSGVKMLRLSGFSGLSSIHVGRRCWIWNSANTGLYIVAAVHGTDTVSLYSPILTTPADDSALSGSICGRIDMSMLELRGRAMVLRNIVCAPGINQRVGCLIDVGNPSGVGGGGGNFVTGVRMEGIKFTTLSGGSSRWNLAIGMPFVPDSNSTLYYSATGQDGTSATIPLVADDATRGNGNVSEGAVNGLLSGGLGLNCGWYAPIVHGSPSGQSVLWDFHHAAIYGQIGCYLVPQRLNGSASANWFQGTVIPGDDFPFRTYAGNRSRMYGFMHNENNGGLLADGAAGGNAAPSIFLGCYARLTNPHPSGPIIQSSSQGPINIIGGLMGLATDSTPWQLVKMDSGSAGESNQVTVLGTNITATTSFASGQNAKWSSSAAVGGIYKLTGTEELDLECDPLSGGAHIRTFTFTEADLVAACANTGGYLTDVLSGQTLPLFGSGAARLNEVYLAHIARVIRYQSAKNSWNIDAWADQDQTILWVCSKTMGSTSRLRISTHSRVGKIDMSVLVGLAAVTANGAAPSELNADTNGVIDNATPLQPTSINDVQVTTIGVHHQNIASSAQQAFPTLVGKPYGTDAIGANGTIQKRTVTISAANIAALGAVMSGAINVGNTVPANARLLGCEVNVTTKVQNAGDTDTTTIDVGISGAVDIAANDISLKTTGRKGESVAGDSTGWVGYLLGSSATQIIATVTSDVNLNTITAGSVTVTVFYWVMP